jgi:hypothetical protein
VAVSKSTAGDLREAAPAPTPNTEASEEEKVAKGGQCKERDEWGGGIC